VEVKEAKEAKVVKMESVVEKVVVKVVVKVVGKVEVMDI